MNNVASTITREQAAVEAKRIMSGEGKGKPAVNIPYEALVDHIIKQYNASHQKLPDYLSELTLMAILKTPPGHSVSDMYFGSPGSTDETDYRRYWQTVARHFFANGFSYTSINTVQDGGLIGGVATNGTGKWVRKAITEIKRSIADQQKQIMVVEDADNLEIAFPIEGPAPPAVPVPATTTAAPMAVPAKKDEFKVIDTSKHVDTMCFECNQYKSAWKCEVTPRNKWYCHVCFGKHVNCEFRHSLIKSPPIATPMEAPIVKTVSNPGAPASNGYTGIVTTLRKLPYTESANITLTWLGPIDYNRLNNIYRVYFDGIPRCGAGPIELEWIDEGNLVTLGKPEDIKEGKGVEARLCRFKDPKYTDHFNAVNKQFYYHEEGQDEERKSGVIKLHVTVGKGGGITRDELLAFKGPFYVHYLFIKNKSNLIHH